MKHISPNGGVEQGGRVDFFLCTFILHIYYLFTDIKANMTDQSSQAELLAGHLLKVSPQKVFLIHLSALCSFSGLSEHATISKKQNKGSVIQGAIISCKSKNT